MKQLQKLGMLGVVILLTAGAVSQWVGRSATSAEPAASEEIDFSQFGESFVPPCPVAEEIRRAFGESDGPFVLLEIDDLTFVWSDGGLEMLRDGWPVEDIVVVEDGDGRLHWSALGTEQGDPTLYGRVAALGGGVVIDIEGPAVVAGTRWLVPLGDPSDADSFLLILPPSSGCTDTNVCGNTCRCFRGTGSCTNSGCDTSASCGAPSVAFCRWTSP